MILSIKEHLKKLIEKEASKSIWSNEDTFHQMKLLSIDQRGRVGEHFLRDVFKELNMKVEYVNNDHDDFDLKVNDNRIEVKTATLDVNDKFQHEGIKNSDKWEAVAFVDITPNDLYLTIIPHEKFTFGENFTNKKGNGAIRGTVNLHGKIQNIHFRGKDNTSERATGAGYKVDFTLKKVKITKTIKDIENIYNEIFKK